MADTPTTSDSADGFSTGESAPTVEYSGFSREVAAPTSTVAPREAREKRDLSLPNRAPAAPGEPKPSRARALLDLQSRERQLAQRAAQVEAAEERFLSAEQRTALELERDRRAGAEYVRSNAEQFPLTTTLGAENQIHALRYELFQRSGGRVYSHKQVADALEQHLAAQYEKANSALRGRRPVTRPASPSQPARQADFSDTRPVDSDERYRRALAAMSAVQSRRSR